MRKSTPKIPYDDPLRHRKTPREMLKEPISTECEACRDNIIQVQRNTIAVIFVPGIMGSKLKDPENAPVWNPDDLSFMSGTYMWANPKERYDLLIKYKPSLLNEITEKHANYPKAEERGWGGVAWSLYGDLLTSIQDWTTPLKVLLDLPVYAFGYNWLESNRVSGERLREFIRTIQAEKVILVTHSMGGLVTRWALGGKDAGDVAGKVLGVIHGAQPVHGAPVAYRRMIAGQEFDGFFDVLGMLGAKVFGKDGPSITAIFPHAESALELLPSQHYRTNDGRREWLHVQDPGSPDGFQSYPKADPYKEIYAKSSHRDFWGMIHGEWFQPEPLEGQAFDSVFYGDATKTDPKSEKRARIFLNRLEMVQNFHATIGEYSHPRTMQIFSSGRQNTCSEVSWLAKDVTLTVKRRPDDMRGDRDLRDRYYALKHIQGILKRSQGEYSEVRWVEADGTPGPTVPWDTPFAELDRGIREERRLFLLRVSKIGYTGPGMPDTCNLGDGTVPLSSATGLQPDCNTWGNATHTLPYWDGADRSMMATGCPTTAEHSKFFDKSAIQATINTIHNLCLGWLREEYD